MDDFNPDGEGCGALVAIFVAVLIAFAIWYALVFG